MTKRCPVLRCLILAVGLAGLLGLGACSKPQDQAGAPPDQSGPDSSGAPPASASPTAENADKDTEAPDDLVSPDGAPAMMSEDAFLAAYRGLDGVVALDSGVMYRIIASGRGKSPKLTDRVRVSYRGTLMDGSVFDETPEGETSDFDVSGLIQGWQQALQLMKEGDKWEIVIPSDLAYGDEGKGPIPPNAPLVFEVELVKVLPPG